MSKIKINVTAPVSGNNVQIGYKNTIVDTKNPLSQYETELLDLFNKNCKTEEEKRELIEDLHKIDIGAPEASKSADKLLTFLNSVNIGLISNGITLILQELLSRK
jgi:hypothetical protein